jgi:hypothetical protein
MVTPKMLLLSNLVEGVEKNKDVAYGLFDTMVGKGGVSRRGM